MSLDPTKFVVDSSSWTSTKLLGQQSRSRHVVAINVTSSVEIAIRRLACRASDSEEKLRRCEHELTDSIHGSEYA